MLIQQNLSLDAEITIQELKVIAQKNKLNIKSKTDLIEFALSLISKAIEKSDDETFDKLFNLKI